MIETFDLVSAPAGARWLLWGVAGILVVAAALVFALVAGMGHAAVEVDEGQLKVASGFFGHQIALADVQAEGVRKVDLTRESDLALSWRTFGTSMPGYQSGWFRLEKGGRAWVHFSDPRRLVYIPTRAGHVILLEVQDPEALVARLRAAS